MLPQIPNTAHGGGMPPLQSPVNQDLGLSREESDSLSQELAYMDNFSE